MVHIFSGDLHRKLCPFFRVVAGTRADPFPLVRAVQQMDVLTHTPQLPISALHLQSPYACPVPARIGHALLFPFVPPWPPILPTSKRSPETEFEANHDEDVLPDEVGAVRHRNVFGYRIGQYVSQIHHPFVPYHVQVLRTGLRPYIRDHLPSRDSVAEAGNHHLRNDSRCGNDGCRRAQFQCIWILAHHCLLVLFRIPLGSYSNPAAAPSCHIQSFLNTLSTNSYYVCISDDNCLIC